MKATIFLKGSIIGFTDLEIGDYHMGGLFGIFSPNDFYLQTIQSKVQAIIDDDIWDMTKIKDLNFEVKMSDGYTLDAIGGIVIYDSKLFDEPIYTN